jgi:uncharacterized UBP type Zn finger protein
MDDKNDRRTRAMSAAATPCTHEDQIKQVTPSSDGCEECAAAGDEWVELRMCLVCGHVGCCDSSKNKHAHAHFRDTGHPVMQEFPDGGWRWCFVDETYL